MKRRIVLYLAVFATLAPAGCARRAAQEAGPAAEEANVGPAHAGGGSEGGRAGAGASHPDLEFSVRAPAVCVVAHPCAAVLTLKNKSRTKSYYYPGSGLHFRDVLIANHYPEFGLRAVRPDGTEAGKTCYAEELAARAAAAEVLELGPQQEAVYTLHLNRALDLSQPGDYLLTVTKEVFAVEGGDFSKKVAFTLRKDNVPLKMVGPPD